MLDAAGVFDRDRFLLRQKHLAISEKYYVWDDEGQVLLYMERPAHAIRNLIAVFGGGIAFFVTMFALIMLSDLVLPNAGDTAILIIVLFVLAASIAAATVVGSFLSKKRHLTMYRDDSKQEPLLVISQDAKLQILNATYTVVTPDGQTLATLSNPLLAKLVRRRWECYDSDDAHWCTAQEDSLVKALLRRFLGTFFGLLRTNFNINAADASLLGTFNRKMTLLDRYVLDMTADPERHLDRRVALALGVMMDTGERR